MTKKNFILFFLLLFSFCAVAQDNNIQVKSFKLLPNDKTTKSNEGKRIDQNGSVAALIKIVTTEKGFAFDGGALGIVGSEQKEGEVWLWVPYGSRKLTILHQRLGVLRDYRYPIEIEADHTYEMVLSVGQMTTIVKELIRQQYLTFQVSPPNAQLEVDDHIWELDEEGTALKFVDFGVYTYRVQAKDYHADAGRVTVDDPDSPKMVKITLRPNFGWIEVDGTGNLQGASVYVDNVLIGHAPCKSEALKSGQYMVRIAKEMYRSYSETVTVTDNETTLLAPTLTTDYTEVTLKVDADAEIWVNDERKGVRTWTGPLGNGLYKIECKQPSHNTSSISQEITADMTGQTIILPLPTPIYGTITVESEPDGCRLYVDGKEVGTSPGTFHEVLIGQREIRFAKDGYVDYVVKVDVEKGGQKRIKATLSPGREVRFTCNVNDAQLEIDDQLVGQANGSYQLTYGSHRLSAYASGYDNYYETIVVAENNVKHQISLKKTEDPIAKANREARKKKSAEILDKVVDGFMGSSEKHDKLGGLHFDLGVSFNKYAPYAEKLEVGYRGKLHYGFYQVFPITIELNTIQFGNYHTLGGGIGSAYTFTNNFALNYGLGYQYNWYTRDKVNLATSNNFYYTVGLTYLFTIREDFASDHHMGFSYSYTHSLGASDHPVSSHSISYVFTEQMSLYMGILATLVGIGMAAYVLKK